MVINETRVQRSDSSFNNVMALLACGASVAIIALAVASDRSGSHEVTSILAPGLWVLGILAVAPLGQVARNPLALVAVGCYVAAFFFPALDSRSFDVSGSMAFYAGWAVVPLAWLANPAIVIALMLERSGRPGAAGTLAAIGVVLALTTLGLPWNGSSPGPGFWMWTIAPGLLTLGCTLESGMRDAAS